MTLIITFVAERHQNLLLGYIRKETAIASCSIGNKDEQSMRHLFLLKMFPFDDFQTNKVMPNSKQ